jgi:hypothetical protein
MEELVVKYLDKNYSMSRANYLSGVVTDKDTNKNLTIVDLYQTIEKVFGVPKTIVTKWWDRKELPFIQEELNQSISR